MATMKEDSERRPRLCDSDIQRYKVYTFDPRTQHLIDIRVHMMSDATLAETLENSYNRFKLRGLVPLERCRLVAYDSTEENIYCSFDGKDEETVRDLMAEVPIISELLLEIRDENASFEVIKPDSIETKIYTVDLNTSDIDGPVLLRVQKSLTVGNYKKLIADKFGWKPNEILVAALKYTSHSSLLEIDSVSLHQEDVSFV